MKLEGKWAIITGAASGIGKAIAACYAKEGAALILVDRDEQRLLQLEHELRAEHVKAHAFVCDLSIVTAILELWQQIIQVTERVDILVNNAGIMDDMAGVGDVELARFEQIMAVNVTAPMLLMKQCIPVFHQQGGGIIINVASIGGLRGSVAGAAYTASKHALVGLTRNTGFQYAKEGIRCNAIAPGAVMTNIAQSMGVVNERGATLCQSGMGNMPRMGEPAEIAGVALFLATPAASYLNGAILTVDGGFSAY